MGSGPAASLQKLTHNSKLFFLDISRTKFEFETSDLSQAIISFYVLIFSLNPCRKKIAMKLGSTNELSYSIGH